MIQTTAFRSRLTLSSVVAAWCARVGDARLDGGPVRPGPGGSLLGARRGPGSPAAGAEL